MKHQTSIICVFILLLHCACITSLGGGGNCDDGPNRISENLGKMNLTAGSRAWMPTDTATNLELYGVDSSKITFAYKGRSLKYILASVNTYHLNTTECGTDLTTICDVQYENMTYASSDVDFDLVVQRVFNVEGFPDGTKVTSDSLRAMGDRLKLVSHTAAYGARPTDLRTTQGFLPDNKFHSSITLHNKTWSNVIEGKSQAYHSSTLWISSIYYIEGLGIVGLKMSDGKLWAKR